MCAHETWEQINFNLLCKQINLLTDTYLYSKLNLLVILQLLDLGTYLLIYLFISFLPYFREEAINLTCLI